MAVSYILEDDEKLQENERFAQKIAGIEGQGI